MNERACAACSAPILGRRSDAMYCSTLCAKRAGARARKQRNRKVRDLSETAECPQCLAQFEVWVPRQCGGYARRSYCTPACTKRAEAARRRQTESGRRYYEQRLKSGKWAEANRRARAAQRRPAVYVCAYCSTAVEGTEDQQRVTCGAEECLRANARQHTTTRNARKRGATVETFRYSEVFERDDWVCGICREPVDPELQFPDPGSVSLDHVHPIARGGEHSRANSQTAHLGCNLRKSATVQAEHVIDSLL